jgi:inorganic phosphate transporter, PiT family
LTGIQAATVVVILVALSFDFTNGFHDAANAIATSVSTRALTPRVALILAALGNLVGSFFGGKVAKTVGEGLITPPGGLNGLGVILAAVLGAIGWNLATWYYGLPSSSSHALFGGLVGANLLAAGGRVHWHLIWVKVIIPMMLSPLAGFVLGYLFMIGMLWLVRRGNPARLNRGFRIAQRFSAAAMAVGHGMQDAAKTIGIVVLALFTGGFAASRTDIPIWVYFACASALALGTYAGGWRIIRTLGRRVIHLGPAEGFSAETVASSVLWFNSQVLGAPISTTHTITSAIMGVGATKRLSAVRWAVAGNIVSAWVLTFPGAGILAAILYVLVHQVF